MSAISTRRPFRQQPRHSAPISDDNRPPSTLTCPTDRGRDNSNGKRFSFVAASVLQTPSGQTPLLRRLPGDYPLRSLQLAETIPRKRKRINDSKHPFPLTLECIRSPVAAMRSSARGTCRHDRRASLAFETAWDGNLPPYRHPLTRLRLPATTATSPRRAVTGPASPPYRPGRKP